jgi:hypothetical protein
MAMIKKVQSSRFKEGVGRERETHPAKLPAPLEGGQGRPPHHPFYGFESAGYFMTECNVK